MCLTFLSRAFLRLDLVEQIWLSVSPEGRCQVQEVYDLFFQTQPGNAEDEAKDTTLLAISSHQLIKPNAELTVVVEPYPGRGLSDFDHVYDPLKAKYVAEGQRFVVELRASKDVYEPETVRCEGEVLIPEIRLPRELATDHAARGIMEQIGTVFEVHLGKLRPSTDYAMRLVVTPYKPNLALEPTNIPEADLSEGAMWEQDLSVISPTSLFSTVNQLLKMLEHLHRGVTVPLQSILSPSKFHGEWKVALIRRHRLFLIHAPQHFLKERGSPGSACFVEAGQLAIPGAGPGSAKRAMRKMEWAGGSESYKGDDPFEVAKAVLGHVCAWGHTDPKTKEEITTSLRLGHENVSLIVDSLANALFLKDASSGRFTIGPKCTFSAQQICDGACDADLQAIAVAPKIAEQFAFSGFELKYSFTYRYESRAARLRRKRSEYRQELGMWSGIIGAGVGVVALIATFFAILKIDIAIWLSVALVVLLGIGYLYLRRSLR